MTKAHPYWPNRPIILYRDNWGNRWVWNRVLSVVEVYPPRKRTPMKSFVLETDNSYHGAMQLSFRKMGFTFLPEKTKGGVAPYIRAGLTS